MASSLRKCLVEMLKWLNGIEFEARNIFQLGPELISKVIFNLVIIPVVLPNIHVFVLISFFVDFISRELFKLIIFFKKTKIYLSFSFFLGHCEIYFSCRSESSNISLV